MFWEEEKKSHYIQKGSQIRKPDFEFSKSFMNRMGFRSSESDQNIGLLVFFFLIQNFL